MEKPGRPFLLVDSLRCTLASYRIDTTHRRPQLSWFPGEYRLSTHLSVPLYLSAYLALSMYLSVFHIYPCTPCFHSYLCPYLLICLSSSMRVRTCLSMCTGCLSCSSCTSPHKVFPGRVRGVVKADNSRHGIPLSVNLIVCISICTLLSSPLCSSFFPPFG